MYHCLPEQAQCLCWPRHAPLSAWAGAVSVLTSACTTVCLGRRSVCADLDMHHCLPQVFEAWCQFRQKGEIFVDSCCTTSTQCTHDCTNNGVPCHQRNAGDLSSALLSGHRAYANVTNQNLERRNCSPRIHEGH